MAPVKCGFLTKQEPLMNEEIKRPLLTHASGGNHHQIPINARNGKL
jgi:hypothetical protein